MGPRRLTTLGSASAVTEMLSRPASAKNSANSGWSLGAWPDLAAGSVRRPGLLLSEVSGALEAAWPLDIFATAVCLSLDQRTGAGRIAVAGQLPPIIKGTSFMSVLDTDGGPPLAIFPRYRYSDRAFVLGYDELLVAATDGITDPLATEVDRLGLVALVGMVARATGGAKDACMSLLNAAEGSGWQDDATALAVGRRASDTPAHRSSSLEQLAMVA